MNKIILVALIIAGVGYGAWYYATHKLGQTITVTMDDNGYSQTSITIKKGDTIEFVNIGTKDRWPASNIHPSHEIYPEFDPKRIIQEGDKWSFRFTKEGSWRWHDHVSPEIGGVIVVE